MPNTQYDFKANVLTKKTAENHFSDFTEGDILFLTDKGIPIPADKVGTADSVDKDKVPAVDADGKYTLKSIDSIPTNGSTNLITSGGVYTAIASAIGNAIGGAY